MCTHGKHACIYHIQNLHKATLVCVCVRVCVCVCVYVCMYVQSKDETADHYINKCVFYYVTTESMVCIYKSEDNLYIM